VEFVEWGEHREEPSGRIDVLSARVHEAQSALRLPLQSSSTHDRLLSESITG
jgi:hypothetical protein